MLNKLPKGLQSKAKQHLHAIWMAEARVAAEAAFDHFIDAYGARYDKAVACLVKDRETLLAFYDCGFRSKPATCSELMSAIVPI